MRGDLIDACSNGRSRSLDECVECEVVGLLLNPSNGAIVTISRTRFA